MKPLRKLSSGLKVFCLMVHSCLLLPVILYAQDSESEGADQAQDQKTSSPFAIKSKSRFGCAEVDEVQTGALASHEITVDPRKVERCLREKVGSRFHECKKLKIIESTADWNGIVTLDTEEGPVRFWFEEHGQESEEIKRVMVWTWPDTDKKYMCAGISSKR
jgi:hypothetical protein